MWGHALLRPVLLTAVAWNLAWFVWQAAYVPYAMRSLGLDASGVGFTLASDGAGMVIGALLAPRGRADGPKTRPDAEQDEGQTGQPAAGPQQRGQHHRTSQHRAGRPHHHHSAKRQRGQHTRRLLHLPAAPVLRA